MHSMKNIFAVIVLVYTATIVYGQSIGVIPAPASVAFFPSKDSIGVTELRPLKLDTPHAKTCFGDNVYILIISHDETTIYAKSNEGFENGKRTLRQIITAHQDCKIPCMEIVDSPHYEYRGMHLDVCRHFFSKDFIKKYIDLLAGYKMNVFHWHLTDDQGWRIKIKKYPRLTEIGAWRTEADSSRYGGYYSQDDIREIVAYAAERYITVIPEIEMPGHSSAALAAYPELGCTGLQLSVPRTWGIKKDIYSPSDSTFRFFEDIIDEVCSLFPSRYIHIGGDEVPKAQWKSSPVAQAVIREQHLRNEEELQHYFMHRIENYLNKRGRSALGWGEVVRGGLSDSMVVMSWMDKSAGIKAAKRGNKVIMAPRGYCYFDYPQKGDKLKAIWMLPLPLKKVYRFRPASKLLNEQQNALILGGEATLWTEYVTSEDAALYQLMPRMAAMAEALWTASDKRNYKDFLHRLSMLHAISSKK